ncbi:MAG: hypothetical protein ACRDKS_08370, partial [Actinomycetota bacterium]
PASGWLMRSPFGHGGIEDDRPLWAPRRVPISVPLACVLVLTSILALGPLSESWQRTHEPRECWTAVPVGCEPRPDLTGPLIQLIVIALAGLAAAIMIDVWRARDAARWRDVDS